MAAVREEVRGSVLGRVERPAVGVPRDALHVAVAERPDRRAGERIVRGDAAVLVYPERLPGRRRGALRVRAVLGIAGRNVELPIRPEPETPAVLRVAPGAAVAEHRPLGPA